jgi:hypothetical protein
MHDLVQVPLRHIQLRNLDRGSGTILHLELTDEDIAKLKDALSYLGVEVTEEK